MAKANAEKKEKKRERRIHVQLDFTEETHGRLVTLARSRRRSLRNMIMVAAEDLLAAESEKVTA